MTEFAKGGDLFSLITKKIKEKQKFPESEIWEYIFQVQKIL